MLSCFFVVVIQFNASCIFKPALTIFFLQKRKFSSSELHCCDHYSYCGRARINKTRIAMVACRALHVCMHLHPYAQTLVSLLKKKMSYFLISSILKLSSKEKCFTCVIPPSPHIKFCCQQDYNFKSFPFPIL